MQLCLCSELLAAVQGRSPEWMHVVSGSGERHSFRVDEFSAFYRRLRRRYEVRLAEGAPLSSSRATIGSIAARADSLA